MNRSILRVAIAVMATAAFLAPSHAFAQVALPLKHKPQPTTAAITAADAMTRLYIFADDSMTGRRAGEVGGLKGTAYIEREVRRLGLVPAGDNGTFFQAVPIGNARPGTLWRTIHGTIRSGMTPAPARNVVAILRGSDPKLRGEFVALGAHNDHLGLLPSAPLDHDSLKAYNEAAERIHVARTHEGTQFPGSGLTPEERASIHVNVDSLHRIRPARPDSIYNGADDDGSGSVGLLEIAERFALTNPKPKRSLIFVWHTGEELGFYGSEFFTDHPTIPRDSIVAQLNIDMVGRGEAADVPGGGPHYVELIGSRRLSTELGDIVETVNKNAKNKFVLDYAFDATGHPERIYCRSDHYEYARYGIPITFFTTGGHSDYHQLTDEPQYINYPHLAGVASFVADIAGYVANLDHRVVVDKPKPDPHGQCTQ